MNKNETADLVLNMLRDFNKDKKLSHSELIEFAKKFYDLCIIVHDCELLNDQEIMDLVIDRYEMLIGVIQPTPVYITNSNPKEWFNYRKEITEFNYFKRYANFLSKNDFPEDTIKTIEKSTEKILGYCADPSGSQFVSEQKKKGLVVGDVQSGKTSNYIALINMACDMGYKIIVLLAGMTSSLREQTQSRIDEGFIGSKSNTLSDVPKFFGVGIDEEKYYGMPLTNLSNDFAKFVKKNLNSSADDYNKPVVLVVKKNKSILESVASWLKPNQNNIKSNNILIIDDEADNASINTKKNIDEISAINFGIRKIFNNFSIASYVGYTATPFANIFINPSEDDPSNQDLFPSDFIVLLESSPSYFGYDRTFEKNDNNEYCHIDIIDENDPYYLPTNHKKEIEYEWLASDLEDAILHFYLSNVVRTLRGSKYKHRSMLINISRFNNVQKQIIEKVEKFHENFSNALMELNRRSDEDFFKYKYFSRLYELWITDKNYAKARTTYTWNMIRDNLLLEVTQVVITLMNNKIKNKDRFSYDDYKETGARVIVVGGLVLSRGLTLEGLLTSYFDRNSTAYDTLLQMCRWFGYRFKYDDICKLYMTQSSVDYFGAVDGAVEHLKKQFRRLADLHKTPRDFGFLVKESPDTLDTTLLVTSRNKMYNSEQVFCVLNYAGYATDTSKIFIDHDINAHNYNCIQELFSSVVNEGYEFDKNFSKPLIKGVDKRFISKIIDSIKIPFENTQFDQESLVKYLEENGQFPKWDIAIASGESKQVFTILTKTVNAVERDYEFKNSEKFYRISRNKNRLFEPSIFAAGLDPKLVEDLKKKKAPKTPIVDDYLQFKDRNPLFIIYPVTLKTDKQENASKACHMFEESSYNNVIYGFAIGFPATEDGVKVKYRANPVKLEQLRRRYEDQEENDDVEESDIDD